MDSTLALLGFLGIALPYAVYRAGQPKPLPFIPHNKLTWLVGDIPLIKSFADEKGAATYALDATALRLGPVSQVVIGLGASWISRIFGLGRILVVLSDSQEIQDVLINRDADFERGDESTTPFKNMSPQGMLSLPTNDQFKRHKRWLGPTMTNPYLARMTPRIVEQAQELVELWSICAPRLKPVVSGGSTTDIAISAEQDLRLATIDVISSIIFGTSFNCTKASAEYVISNPSASPSARPKLLKLGQDLQVLMDSVGEGMKLWAPVRLWYQRNLNRKWRGAKQRTLDFLTEQLRAARAANEGSEKIGANRADNVLEMIIEREKEDAGKGVEGLRGDEILDTMTLFAIGGFETTATTLQWAFKNLCKHPDVQRKLRAELLNNLPSMDTRPPTFSEICDEDNLPYLSAVVYEVLRCARTTSATGREATRDTVLLGYPIPKGTTVILGLGMVQMTEIEKPLPNTPEDMDELRSASSKRAGRKSGYWSPTDVHEFKPERWLRPEDGSFNAAAGPWIPFSVGFRGCFGQKLAVLELRLFLAIVQANFFFEAVPEEMNSWKSIEVVTNRPVECYVRPVPWEKVEMEKDLLL
ncbi:cytochrome P450 [Mycena crocata]|nr:cytochrome P450 [Mycena crocata]